MRAFVVAVTAVLSLAAPLSAHAQDLNQLLDKGQVVLVEQDAKGRFKQATAVIVINKPVEEVWKIAIDMGKYKDFMPKVVKSDVKDAGKNKKDLDLEIEVPGVNTAYTFRYELDDAAHVIKGKWLKGDIKDSQCEWRLVPVNGGTLFYYSVSTKNFSGIAQSLEDDQQTITVGVNVGAALATAKAVKERAEGSAATTAAASP